MLAGISSSLLPGSKQLLLPVLTPFNQKLSCVCVFAMQPVFMSESSQLLQQARQEMEALAAFVSSAQVSTCLAPAPSGVGD
jgi:hypothetical protein